MITTHDNIGPVLITGGAGFIGTNLAHRLLSQGQDVILFDNLSRDGVERNLLWLLDQHGSRIRFIHADTRDASAIATAVQSAARVFHFAAQVAVTTSLNDPLEDFEVNALGTLNLLEAIRALNRPVPLLFTSTNKVYGDLHEVPLVQRNGRYAPADDAIAGGIGEDYGVDFHSPYGCSKGAADQYVLDYARTFGMPTVVFRMSCIYGPHQFGTEDQGWVAHFLLRALRGEPIMIYGDGCQVRDILYVDDLARAMLLAHEHIDDLSGQAFNIGGGPRNTVSLLELIELISKLHRAPSLQFGDWRSADQRFYVSDTDAFSAATGWVPQVRVADGIARLHRWLTENRVADVGSQNLEPLCKPAMARIR